MDNDKYIYDIKYNHKEKIYNVNDKYFTDKMQAAQWAHAKDSRDEVEERRQALVKSLKEIDVSSSLSEDAAAKLQLLHGDFLIIPIEKLGKK